MSLRSPLAKVKGLGSSGHASGHWWLQRLSALALIPLSLWFVFSVIGHLNDDQQSLTAWIATPGVSLALILYAFFMFFHAQLGLQVVIEDYVHHAATKLSLLLLNKAIMLLSGVAMIYAILRITL